jgi:hypothetical protein
MAIDLDRQPNFAAMLGLAWLITTMVLLLVYWPGTAQSLLDADDAMRLVQFRAWLDGPGLFSGWYDMHQPRLQPPAGIEMHWSRLIDAGLAGLYGMFRLFAEPSDAERLMRTWWPLLWLLPTMAGMTAIAWRIAGRDAAVVALLFAVLGAPAYQPFTPGRIDHHNVQIALTLLAVAATAWSDRKPFTAYAAGALSGAALAVGFESLPFLAVCGAVLAIRYVVDRYDGPALCRYGLALTPAALLGFAVSVAPTQWKRPLCDAIALNNVAAVVCAALVLALAGWLGHRHRVTRLAAVLAAAVAAAAVLLLVDPRCLHGPLALVDPAIWPLWLDGVREMQPLHAVLRIDPLIAVAIAAFPMAALYAVAVLLRDRDMRGNSGFQVASLAFVCAVAATVAAIRGYPYAIWLGMPLVAALVLRLYRVGQIERLVPRIGLAAVFAPMVLSAGAVTVAVAMGFSDSDAPSLPDNRACLATPNYAALRALEPGLIAADVGLGPYLLALTLHSVLAAPYHRLSSGIVSAHRILAEPPDRARAVATEAKVKYILICGRRPPDGLAEPARSQSLWAQLRSGAVPGWLTPVEAGPVFTVYRMAGT